jgi:hypothetical protein
MSSGAPIGNGYTKKLSCPSCGIIAQKRCGRNTLDILGFNDIFCEAGKESALVRKRHSRQ